MDEIKRMRRVVTREKFFFLSMKGMVYQSCVRSAMLYGNETCCLRESEMAIFMKN